MTPKSKYFKLIVLIGFCWLFLILLMNIFNSGHSYYYSDSDVRPLHEKKSSNLFSNWFQPQSKQQLQQQVQQQEEDDDIGGLIKEPPLDELLASLEKQLPSVPFIYSHNHKNQTMQKFKNCAVFPDLQKLNYYNNYWQTYVTKNVTFQLYGAYYDERQGNTKGAVIRILAMTNQKITEFPVSYCQVWYDGDTRPQIAKIESYKHMWNFGRSASLYYPVLLTCPLVAYNETLGVPKVVSMVDQQCYSAANSLKVTFEKPQEEQQQQEGIRRRSPFAVCVKGLDFPYTDLSQRLVEWLEMMRLLGADKVFMYEIAIHPNIRKVLDYYQREGFLEVRPINLLGGVVNLPEMQHWMLQKSLFNKRLNEFIPYNDCFYRNMYKYDYLAGVDVDEVIMPMGNLTSWHDLLESVKPFEEEKQKKCPNGFASVCASNVYYPFSPEEFIMENRNDSNEEMELEDAEKTKLPQPPAYMFMLNHLYRFKLHSKVGLQTKCLHNTRQAVALHNHYSVSWFDGACRPLNLPHSLAQMQHYHNEHPKQPKTTVNTTADINLNVIIYDANILRFQNDLVKSTTKVLKNLKLL